MLLQSPRHLYARVLKQTSFLNYTFGVFLLSFLPSFPPSLPPSFLPSFFFFLISCIYMSVHLGCYDKIPHTERLKQKHFLQFWRLEAQDPAASMVR